MGEKQHQEAQEKGRASLGHVGGRDACLETADLFLCDPVVSSRPQCCPHVLDPLVSC